MCMFKVNDFVTYESKAGLLNCSIESIIEGVYYLIVIDGEYKGYRYHTGDVNILGIDTDNIIREIAIQQCIQQRRNFINSLSKRDKKEYEKSTAGFNEEQYIRTNFKRYLLQ